MMALDEAVGPGAGRSVLLVDDEPALRRQLARALEKDGFVVHAAASLKEAHAQVAEAPPELAVLDLNLEDGHGMELVRAILDARPGARIIILTGYDSIASSVIALKAGAAGYLAKPVKPEQVTAALLGAEPADAAPGPQPMSADRVKWEHIQRVFEQCDRNVSETARRLDMHRRTLQRILSKRAPRG